jgi:Ca2+-binding RTX toxin-like protein
MWLGDGDDHGLITGNVRIPYTMVGGDGDDILKGGGGRGILIGGLGADRLTGGRDDDILIGGTTDYDSNDVALLALLTEWNSDRSYEDRVANISSGTGPLLDDLGFLLDGDTVHDDVDLDRLVGGRGDDWFFGTDDEIRGHGCRW